MLLYCDIFSFVKQKYERDTSFFDQEFTSNPPTLTPAQSILGKADEQVFKDFDYSPPNLSIEN